MESIDNIQQYNFYVDTIPVPGIPNCWEFVHKDGTKKLFPEFDFYIPLKLQKTYEVWEYVQVDKEKEILPIIRQEVNPFYIEFGFFEDIERNRVNRGVELTVAMINFIRVRRPDISSLTNNQIKEWFDDIGINEFPWNKGTAEETTADDIDEVSFVAGHIVSKAKFLGIDIHK